MKEPSRRRFLQRTVAASFGVAAAERAGSADAAQSVALAGTSYVGARKVLLWESTRKEFREAVEGNTLKAMIDDEQFHRDAKLSGHCQGRGDDFHGGHVDGGRPAPDDC